jgi:hypothetical protein
MTGKRLTPDIIEEISRAAQNLRDGTFDDRKFVARMKAHYSDVNELKRAITYEVLLRHMHTVGGTTEEQLSFFTQAYKEGMNIRYCLSVFGKPDESDFTIELYKALDDIEIWLQKNESLLRDVRNPEGWLRNLQREFGINMRNRAFDYALEDEYQNLLADYGEHRLGTVLSESLRTVIGHLSPTHQELLYTYLLEPTFVGVDDSLLRHQDVQNELNEYLVQVARELGGQGIVDTNLTDGKSEESLYYKLHNGDPETARTYKDAQKFIGQLVRTCGDLSSTKKVLFAGEPLWDILNHFYRHHAGHGLVRPFYPNFIRDGARAMLLPHTAGKFREILRVFDERNTSGASERLTYGHLDTETGMVYPAEWIRSIFPETRVTIGGFSNGIEVRRSGLVFATYMIPFDADGKEHTPDDTVVAEVQIMSPNMRVAKHWEDVIYKAKTHIDAGTAAGRNAQAALSELGLAYYLTAINADVSIPGGEWAAFYQEAFDKAQQEDRRYALVPANATYTYFQQINTPPNGQMEFEPDWLRQLPDDGYLKELQPPAFLMQLESKALNALSKLDNSIKHDELVKHCVGMLEGHLGVAGV